MSTNTLPNQKSSTTQNTWFQEFQQKAAQNYQQIPAPKRGNEAWRFASLKQLETLTDPGPQTNPISPEAQKAATTLALNSALPHTAAHFIFADDQCIATPTELNPTYREQGVICQTLAQALQNHPDLVQTHFMSHQAQLGSAKYAALHASRVTNGFFLHIPKGITIDQPIEITHIVTGEQPITYPHTLIITEEGSQATVVERFLSLNPHSQSWLLAVNDLKIANNAQLTYLTLQDLNLKSRMVQINDTETASQARSKAFLLNLGTTWIRQESMSRLLGPEAHSDMLSVSLPTGEQQIDQRTFQHHISQGAYSDLLYKNTLFDHAKTVFSGLIFVDEGAHDTDAYQTCRNLLLSEQAEAHSMPGLEINADQVKCSHGSTTARLSRDEVSYLMSRGIDEETSYRLVARGFSVEVIERLQSEELEKHILALVDRKFQTISSTS